MRIRPSDTKWGQRLADDKGFKIGLAWTGRNDHYRNELRSVPVFGLVEALKGIESISLYSLQQLEPDQANLRKRG
jgi:hypothetical protein